MKTVLASQPLTPTLSRHHGAREMGVLVYFKPFHTSFFAARMMPAEDEKEQNDFHTHLFPLVLVGLRSPGRNCVTSRASVAGVPSVYVTRLSMSGLGIAIWLPGNTLL